MKLLNALLVLVGLLIPLIVAELFLRHFVDPVTSMAVWFDPEGSRKAYEWQFLKAANCNAGVFSGFDPDLGWNIGGTGVRRISRSTAEANEPPLRILFIGDSFVYGSEVSDDQTTAHYVAELSANAVVANMGVPGFGIGQSYLKLVKSGLAWKPDIVIFGIHPPNYERTVMGFFNRPKPTFRISETDGSLRIGSPPPDSANADFCQALSESRINDVFLAEFIRKVFYRFYSPARSDGIEDYFKKHDPIIRKILRNTHQLLTENGIKLFVLQIPHGNQFRSDAYQQEYRERYPIPQRLIQIYEDTDILHVDLRFEMLDRNNRSTVFEKYYTHPNGRNSAGHFPPLGNKFAAEVILEKICISLPYECRKYLKNPSAN
jgi:hypothetical protein